MTWTGQNQGQWDRWDRIVNMNDDRARRGFEGMQYCKTCDIRITASGCPACDAKRTADYFQRCADDVRDTYEKIKGVKDDANRTRALAAGEESLMREARNWRSVAGDIIRLEQSRQKRES